MDCATCEAMVDAYVDGELSAVESAELERTLPACPECRRRLAMARELSGLLRALPAEPVPDLLRARVERELRSIAGRPRERLRWAAIATSLVAAVGIGWLGGLLSSGEGREDRALIAGYLRVAMSDHAVDVASSDRHTVKPWFAGRIDYAPPVHDLTSQGFPLAGGRVDVVDGRTVAVLVYQRNRHKLVLTVWPSSVPGSAAPNVIRRDGFALAQWRQAGFDLRAVSDISGTDMAAFAAAMGRALDAER